MAKNNSDEIPSDSTTGQHSATSYMLPQLLSLQSLVCQHSKSMNYIYACHLLDLGIFPTKLEVKKSFETLYTECTTGEFAGHRSTAVRDRLKELSAAKKYLCEVALLDVPDNGRIYEHPFPLGLHLRLFPPLEHRNYSASITSLQTGAKILLPPPKMEGNEARMSQDEQAPWVVSVPTGTLPGTILLSSRTGSYSTKVVGMEWMAVEIEAETSSMLYLNGLDIHQMISVHPEDFKNVRLIKFESPDGKSKSIMYVQPVLRSAVLTHVHRFPNEGLLKNRTVTDRGRYIVTVLITKDADRLTSTEICENYSVHSSRNFSLYKYLPQ